MPIKIKNSKIFENGGAGISVPVDVDLIIEDTLIAGNKLDGIEIRELRYLKDEALSQLEKSNVSVSDKTRIKSSIIRLIKSFPEVSSKLIKGSALTVETLANSPEAYKAVTSLFEFIKTHSVLI